MSGQGAAQIFVFAVVLVAFAHPLGRWLAHVYGGRFRAPGVLGTVERSFYRVLRTDPNEEQDWKGYALAALVFSAVCMAALYLTLRLQGDLSLNPDGLGAMAPQLALNTAASFVTNTSWQFYGGESTLSYLSQMAGIAVHSFLSAAVGMAVLAAVARGFSRRSRTELGNFWVDLYRSLAYVLLPLSLVVAAILVWQGVPQTFEGSATATTLEGATQTIARGPVASQEAIKLLSMDGGGFYNSNSAVPFENPTGLSNFVELLALLLIPAAQVFMFGRMVSARRHAAVVFVAMGVMLVIGLGVMLAAEQHGSAVLRDSGVNITQGADQSGGNMSDKEVRFGIASTSFFATATTATSDGAVNSGHDAFTPAGGAVALTNMFLGEVIFGGVGSGLYSMLFMILLAVFVAGLMVGRTPEYLGKRIEQREVKLAVLGALFTPTLALTATAAAIASSAGLESVFNPGAHGFTEALYAWTSMANTNGSAFAGYGGTSFSATLGAVVMIFGRYVPLLAALALAGSLAGKRTAMPSAGTVRTDGATFAVLLISVIVLSAGLMLLPALALGPIVEGLAK
jgi:K+-transporting ATPase ATPase A chain